MLLLPAHTSINWLALRNAAGAVVALILAFEPAGWLLGTWTQPGYQGLGWVPAVLTLLLMLWSLSSAPANHARSNISIYVLLTTTVLRLLSQLLDINVVGALLLCVDVFAVAHLLGLHKRSRPVAPVWLALLFAFSLPLEPMMQRVFGYLLQQISAWTACGLLSIGWGDVQCASTRITLQGADLLVDLPCSGAQLLSTSGCVLALLCAALRPQRSRTLLACAAFLPLTIAANSGRISLLALGLANRDAVGFDVMQPAIHESIGLVFVLLLATVFYALLRTDTRPTHDLAAAASAEVPGGIRSQALVTVALLPLALAIGAVPPQPLDAAPSLPSPTAPGVAAGFLAASHPLTDQERTYFTRYGGSARRLSYGPFGLLLVSTASPLRHLHDPAICMSAHGYDVTLLGTDHATRSTVYRAIDESGQTSYLHVSYLSARGEVATSISEVVWHWLANPVRWTMVQRIVPEAQHRQGAGFDAAMRRAFNV